MISAPNRIVEYGYLIAGGLLLLGCGSPAGPVGQGKDPCEVAQEIRPKPEFLTVPEEANIVARIAPGRFGGLFQDLGNTDRLVLYLQDLAKTDSATTVIRRLLSCGGAYPGWSNRLLDPNNPLTREGQYTASQLLNYSHALEQLRSDAGVWGIEVDPETNRVWIGLRAASELTRVRGIVTSAGVPSEAVDLEVPPPVTGTEPFRVLDSVVIPRVHLTDNGVFLAGTRVEYTNHFQETRYPDNCVIVGGGAFSFLYHIEKWNGQSWRKIHDPDCLAIALAPRPVPPGASMTDSVQFVGVRRINASPIWKTARITGTYRFVGRMYLSTTPNAPFVANPAPEPQNSTPFRIINTLPF